MSKNVDRGQRKSKFKVALTGTPKALAANAAPLATTHPLPTSAIKAPLPTASASKAPLPTPTTKAPLPTPSAPVTTQSAASLVATTPNIVTTLNIATTPDVATAPYVARTPLSTDACTLVASQVQPSSLATSTAPLTTSSLLIIDETQTAQAAEEPLTATEAGPPLPSAAAVTHKSSCNKPGKKTSRSKGKEKSKGKGKKTIGERQAGLSKTQGLLHGCTAAQEPISGTSLSPTFSLAASGVPLLDSTWTQPASPTWPTHA